MAGQLGGRRRVFVLVDKGLAQGVFTSWDAAEAYADEHRFSLDHLMEYETRLDHPDHLHLMAAEWEGEWSFQGEWTRIPPKWPKPPRKIRLDHYHAKGNEFHLLRQKEVDWEANLLGRINPMAPEHALVADGQAARKPIQPQVPQWKPKLTPLKPPASTVLMEETEPPVGELGPEAAKVEEKASVSPPEVTKPRISFQKKQPLRLRSRTGPQPIPSFRPTVAMVADPGEGKSTVELAHADLESARGEQGKDEMESGKPRRIWSLRLIISLAAVAACWAGGVYWVLRPEPPAASLVAQVASLNSASKLILEPEMVFFQLPVEPAYQERWIQSLGLKVIPEAQSRMVPTLHALSTWAKPDGFIRPPYSMTEVDEWWKLRLREVKYGFTYDWDDGYSMILDFESDLLISFAPAGRLREVLN